MEVVPVIWHHFTVIGVKVIIMVNILIRPALWTAFNIVGLIYLWFTVILGGYKMVQLSTIVKTYLSLEDIDETG